MTAVKDHTGGDHHLYVRNFDNDLPSSAPARRTWAGQATRVAKVALPYLSLYQPISKPLTLAMGAVRSLQSAQSLVTAIQSGERLAILRAVVELAVAVASVAGTIFAHPLGMVISTTHDLVLAIAGLVQAIRSGDCEAILQASLQVASSALYLALMGFGGMHLMIASTALQIAIGAVQSRQEWARGNYLEALGQLGMVVIRGKQLVGQVQASIQVTRAKRAMEEIKKLTEKASLRAPPKHAEAPEIRVAESAQTRAAAVDQLDLSQPDFNANDMRDLLLAIAKHHNNGVGLNGLEHAVLQQDHRAVDLFLRAGASPLQSQSHGPSCLSLAVALQDEKLVQRFIDLGAFRLMDGLDVHVLDLAFRGGNTKIIEILMGKILELPKEEALSGFQTAIGSAVYYGRDDVLTQLLTADAWIQALRDKLGEKTVAHWFSLACWPVDPKWHTVESHPYWRYFRNRRRFFPQAWPQTLPSEDGRWRCLEILEQHCDRLHSGGQKFVIDPNWIGSLKALKFFASKDRLNSNSSNPLGFGDDGMVGWCPREPEAVLQRWETLWRLNLARTEHVNSEQLRSQLMVWLREDREAWTREHESVVYWLIGRGFDINTPIHGFSLLRCIGNDPNNPSISAVREFLISLGARP